MAKKYSDKTKGVQTLLGEPKKAVLTLAIPMIIAMSANTIYNLVDAIWVSGFGQNFFTNIDITDIGTNALAAVGYVMPFFMMLISIAVGIGIGGGSAISRRIGAKDKTGADNCAIHSIIISLIIAFIFTIILFLSANNIFLSIGAADISNMAVSYGRVIFTGSVFIFFINNSLAILRAEGDANRAMYAMLFGAILNIILDPIFIYTFRFGVTGAAYATVLSMGVTSMILFYWTFIKKDTYVSFKIKDFKFKKDILKDIFKVGLPASFQQLSMSITMLGIIIIINIAGGGNEGVAVYNTGWRIVMIAVLPLLGMATAVTSVTGAAYGSKSYEKLNTAFLYASKTGLIIEIILAVIIFFAAPLIAIVFTTRPEDIIIRENLTIFLQISIFFYPGASIGIASSAMFQGTGKGTYSLIATLLRTIILTIVFALISTLILNAGIVGIWWSLVFANLIGSIVSFTWGKIYINKLFKQSKQSKILM
ncbi:MATE family efflux transporter [Thermoplasmatales archaeon SG8-52-4]|nr:MAG: MATE family efflux transporter [Thermoplasmatales archaeon SG8-52-4]